MRTRITMAIAAAVFITSLTACSSSSDDDSKPAMATPPASTPADNDAEKAAGIPPEPTGAERVALLAALKAINPALVADEDKAITNARNQCSTIKGSGNADASAKARFSTSGHEVSDTEAVAINAALKASLCK